MTSFTDLKGKTLNRIVIQREVDDEGDDRIIFIEDRSNAWVLFHQQDCCETVVIEEIHGDMADLVGTPILLAELVTKEGERIDNEDGYDEYYSQTWSFYKLATVKGHVTIRWLGESNGYYSEEVDFKTFPRWKGDAEILFATEYDYTLPLDGEAKAHFALWSNR